MSGIFPNGAGGLLIFTSKTGRPGAKVRLVAGGGNDPGAVRQLCRGRKRSDARASRYAFDQLMLA